MPGAGSGVVVMPGAGGRGMDDEEDVSFEGFFAQAYPGLRRLALARTGSWDAAEDLVQDAMADAQRRWEKIGRYDDPAAWARRAVLNRSSSRLRGRERERLALRRLAGRAEHQPPAEPVFADEELWEAIRSLSERQMEVVLLLWFEELSVGEVALSLECGEQTVRTHWRRARARLAEALGERDDPEEER